MARCRRDWTRRGYAMPVQGHGVIPTAKHLNATRQTAEPNYGARPPDFCGESNYSVGSAVLTTIGEHDANFAQKLFSGHSKQSTYAGILKRREGHTTTVQDWL